MYRRYAVKFNRKQVEFIDCLNMVERVKKARALHKGVSHLGVKRYVLSSCGLGKDKYIKLKDCV